jgi:hypothetical protein
VTRRGFSWTWCGFVSWGVAVGFGRSETDAGARRLTRALGCTGLEDHDEVASVRPTGGDSYARSLMGNALQSESNGDLRGIPQMLAAKQPTVRETAGSRGTLLSGG